jgi:nucleotide-binding universal stress UspA family protein
VIAYFVGDYTDIRTGYFRSMTEDFSADETVIKQDNHNVLLVIIEADNSMKAVSYFINTFARLKGTKLTMLCIARDQPSEVYPDKDAYETAKKENEEKFKAFIEKTRNMLLTVGLPETSIVVKEDTAIKGNALDKIAEEQKTFQYDTILIGGTQMTKAEEFILGNIAVKLVRAAIGPVITVF